MPFRWARSSTWSPLWVSWKESSRTATTRFAAGLNNEIPLDHRAAPAGAGIGAHSGTQRLGLAGAVSLESRFERARTHRPLPPAALAGPGRSVSGAQHERRPRSPAVRAGA